jgi:hypothetical protein
MNAWASGVLRISPSRIGPRGCVKCRPHVLLCLVDDQLHRRNLRGGDARELLRLPATSASSCSNGTALLISSISAASPPDSGSP